MDSIQEFLKHKAKEAGVTQDELANRLGWIKQNVNYKLNHKNARFGSMLAIAEAIGLGIKFQPENFCYQPYIEAAVDIEISYEDFEKLVFALGYDIAFDWRKPGDTVYTIAKEEEHDS